MKLPSIFIAAAALAMPLSTQAGDIIKKKWYDSDGKLVEQYVYSGKKTKREYQRSASDHRRYPPYRGYTTPYYSNRRGYYYAGGRSCGTAYRPVVRTTRSRTSVRTAAPVTIFRSSGTRRRK